MRSSDPKVPNNISIWFGFFFYTLLIGLLIQLILLPYVFPSWNSGDGLLIGLDTEDFHKLVIEQLNIIESNGWSAWIPKPGGQIVAGVAVIFYGLISPHPWSMLPINSVLHATAGLSIFLILNSFIKHRKKALIATLPYVLFPTALSWTAQYHNDNYMVAGVALFLLGWVLFFNRGTWGNWEKIGMAIIFVISGCILIWLVRGYVLSILVILGSIVGIILTFYVCFLVIIKHKTLNQAVLVLIIIWITLAASHLLMYVRLDNRGLRFNIGQSPFGSVGLITEGSADQTINENINHNYTWKKTTWLPTIIDTNLRSLVKVRRSGYKPNAGSNLDYEIQLLSAVDVLKYLPRALEIGFFAPFPNQWFEVSKKAPNTILRKVAGMEMVIVYASWLGLLFSIWKWRKNPGFWVFMFFNTAMIVIYALAVVNAGTLTRFRYAFLMPLVGFGVMGGFEIHRLIITLWKPKDKAKVN
jgi:hypothetical protein